MCIFDISFHHQTYNTTYKIEFSDNTKLNELFEQRKLYRNQRFLPTIINLLRFSLHLGIFGSSAPKTEGVVKERGEKQIDRIKRKLPNSGLGLIAVRNLVKS